jgi:phage head maturation protease
MKYEVGDDIIVVHSSDEGKVIEIINDKMVLIEVKGVKFPAYMDQIDFPYFKRFTQKKLFRKSQSQKYM